MSESRQRLPRFFFRSWGLRRTQLVVPPFRYFSDEPDLSPFLKALHETRHLATREGWCRRHVEAIMVAIDQYAEAATGNREYF
jgi:hypothetical protein